MAGGVWRRGESPAAVSTTHPFPMYHAPRRCAEEGAEGKREGGNAKERNGSGAPPLSAGPPPRPLFGKAAQLFLILWYPQPRPRGWRAAAPEQPGRLSPAEPRQ